ncbi:MAG TPA: ABC transporter substrate-binding protein [Candidatus Limnocylindrales bacterium]|nr:ABC transporter substrate-binding protein [Candidatus Limnocylindrales bacterium]
MRKFGAIVAMVVLVGACGGGPSPAPSTATSSPAATPKPAASAILSPSSRATPATVRLALDWTPNTNHTGFFVAEHEGWYADAAITLRILPYSGTLPETLIGAHQAECGISFQDSLTFAVAAGVKATSVMAILQRTASKIAVLESSAIERPRDLDGRVYGGFGYPNEVPTIKFVIQHDGGKGDFKNVVIDTAAYEALYAKRVDFTIPFTAWEGVEADLRGIKLRYFAFTDFGFPDFYQVILACDPDWLAREPDAARRFVAATVRGFELAARDPDGAAQMLIDENPAAFAANPELPKASAELLARDGYYVDDSGRVGPQTLERWQGYSGFLYDQGLLVDAAGKALTTPPDYTALFTNDFLP